MTAQRYLRKAGGAAVMALFSCIMAANSAPLEVDVDSALYLRDAGGRITSPMMVALSLTAAYLPQGRSTVFVMRDSADPATPPVRVITFEHVALPDLDRATFDIAPDMPPFMQDGVYQLRFVITESGASAPDTPGAFRLEASAPFTVVPQEGTTAALRAVYLNAVERAQETFQVEEAARDTVKTDLLAITPQSPLLEWQGDAGNTVKCVIVSYSRWNGGDTGTTHLSSVTWVTPAPEVLLMAAREGLTASDANLRLEQYVGISPTGRSVDQKYIAECWVNTRHLFRPSRDPEISDSAANTTFGALPSPLEQQMAEAGQPVRIWIANWLLSAYGNDQMPYYARYPFTGMGYTFDWGAPSCRGASEYCIMSGAAVDVIAVRTVRDYLSLDGASDGPISVRPLADAIYAYSYARGPAPLCDIFIHGLSLQNSADETAHLTGIMLELIDVDPVTGKTNVVQTRLVQPDECAAAMGEAAERLREQSAAPDADIDILKNYARPLDTEVSRLAHTAAIAPGEWGALQNLTLQTADVVPEALRITVTATLGSDAAHSRRTISHKEIPLRAPIRENRYLFPLQGVVFADDGPAGGIGSHHRATATQEFAWDFLPLDAATGALFHSTGTANADWSGWNADIRAAAAGRVIAVADGMPDNPAPGTMPGLPPDRVAAYGALQTLVGNHVIVDHGRGEFALYAHCALGSVSVRSGETVAAGQVLARLGNSGNSSAPHLHFQVMTAADMLHAHALPVTFDNVRDLPPLSGDTAESLYSEESSIITTY